MTDRSWTRTPGKLAAVFFASWLATMMVHEARGLLFSSAAAADDLGEARARVHAGDRVRRANRADPESLNSAPERELRVPPAGGRERSSRRKIRSHGGQTSSHPSSR